MHIERGMVRHKPRAESRLEYILADKGKPGLPFDADAARHYGPIRAELEQRGRLIGPYDLMIAAQARAVGAALVTDNVGEFSRVTGLKTVNWLVP